MHLYEIPDSELIGNRVVLEEKMDGSQAGIKFSPGRELILFSRGHVLDGGHLGESQFDLFKQWANTKKEDLWNLLGPDHIMYGEWLYAVHSIYYDMLPHYFLEYDIYNIKDEVWYSTPRRHKMLDGTSIKSVKVLDQIDVTEKNIDALMIASMEYGKSHFKSDKWIDILNNDINEAGLDAVELHGDLDMTGLIEGYYIKIEKDGKTIGRGKSVRSEFINLAANSFHWTKRSMITNRLNNNTNIWC